MTTVLDLTITVASIIEVPEPTNLNKWIYGFHFKQLLDAIKVFRAYFFERKASYGIPQSLFDELDGYITKFPSPYFHYTVKSSDQNNMVDAIVVLGQMTQYSPPPVGIGYLKKIYVHWLNPNGSIKQTFDYYAGQLPKIAHWVDGVDYPDGNIRVEQVWHADTNKSIRSDTRIYLKWSKVLQDWVIGTCSDTPIHQDYSFFSYVRMASEDITLTCRLVNCADETEFAAIPIPIAVSDVAPPPPLTASISGTIKGYFPNRSPTDQPLAGVTISVSTLSTLTDASGNYNITGIPVGYHTWKASKTGWRDIKVSEEYRSGDVKHRDATMVPSS